MISNVSWCSAKIYNKQTQQSDLTSAALEPVSHPLLILLYLSGFGNIRYFCKRFRKRSEIHAIFAHIFFTIGRNSLAGCRNKQGSDVFSLQDILQDLGLGSFRDHAGDSVLHQHIHRQDLRLHAACT